MLTILFGILSILGILLLFLLCLVILVLFLPVAYRIKGTRDIEKMELSVRIRWLFGVVRADYYYPSSDRLKVRLLFFKIYDSNAVKKEQPKKDSEKKHKKSPKRTKKQEPEADSAFHHYEPLDNREEEAAAEHNKRTDFREEDQKDAASGPVSGTKSWWERRIEGILAKYVKLKYTIKGICDKIKDILENFDYYRNLLQEEETWLLYGYAKGKIGRILKDIHPRRLKAEIQFGTGSPDTTGYALGLIGMLSPFLGKNINITPNFEKMILLGELYAAGRVTGFILLANLYRLFTDKRLRLFLRRIKREDM